MNRRMILKLTVMAVFLAAGAATSAFALDELRPNSLWYRGFFDGEMQIQPGGATPGYHYYPSQGATYPLMEQRYSAPLPCDLCGHQHRPSGYCPQCGKICSGNGSHVTAEDVYQPYRMLPGQYYYEKQPHFSFRSPINAGWPYVQYDQRW